jgi:hypothetical protein
MLHHHSAVYECGENRVGYTKSRQAAATMHWAVKLARTIALADEQKFRKPRRRPPGSNIGA